VVWDGHGSLCGIRGPAGQSVPKAPRWQKTALAQLQQRRATSCWNVFSVKFLWIFYCS